MISDPLVTLVGLDAVFKSSHSDQKISLLQGRTGVAGSPTNKEKKRARGSKIVLCQEERFPYFQ